MRSASPALALHAQPTPAAPRRARAGGPAAPPLRFCAQKRGAREPQERFRRRTIERWAAALVARVTA
jgi:hypothetical protein